MTLILRDGEQRQTLFQEGEDADEWDADPGGAVVEFVEELVERFFEEIGVEQELGLRGLRDEIGVCRGDGALIGAKEFGGDGVLPEAGPGFEIFRIGFTVWGTTLGEGVECGIGGVAEGTQHAGDIFERGLFGAALGEAAGGFTFEVEDDVVITGTKNLAQVVVAVDADALASFVRRGRCDGSGAGEELDAAAEEDGGVVRDGVRELGQAALESAEGEG